MEGWDIGGEVKKNNLSENIVKEFHFLIKNRFVSRMNVCTYFAIFMFVSNSSLSGIPKSKRSNFLVFDNRLKLGTN